MSTHFVLFLSSKTDTTEHRFLTVDKAMEFLKQFIADSPENYTGHNLYVVDRSLVHSAGTPHYTDFEDLTKEENDAA